MNNKYEALSSSALQGRVNTSSPSWDLHGVGSDICSGISTAAFTMRSLPKQIYSCLPLFCVDFSESPLLTVNKAVCVWTVWVFHAYWAVGRWICMCPEAWSERTVFQCAVSFQAAGLSCIQVSWMLGISFGSKKNKLIMEKKNHIIK